MLTAYAQAAPAGVLRVWIGLFGMEHPQPLTIEIDGQPHAHEVVDALRPIRDCVMGAGGKPLNHRAILQVPDLQPGMPYRVSIISGDERFTLSTHTLPNELPQKLDGTFNILLCSCYSQPEDAAGLLGTVVSQIMLRPHLTLMMGDQIYGDLPISENLPEDAAGVARKIGMKYFRNWTSSQLASGGLAPVLTRAPVICVADDHEYWNNYPYAQTQLPKTWTKEGRAQWGDVAKALYEDYELAGSAGGVQRLDIDPLKLIVVDMRSRRDDKFDQLIPPQTLADIKTWAADLIQAKNDGKPAFGLLSSGQALFAAPASESERTKMDAELGNYTQFENEIMPVLDTLADAGIPVVYITGDVHWGRVSQRRDRLTNRPMLYEVIASPSRMIRTPVLDAAKEAKARLGGLFGKADPWPRHSEAPPVPDPWGSKRNFQLQCDVKSRWGHVQRGDHIAVMSLAKSAGGVDFEVTYYAVTQDKALAKSVTTRTFELRLN
jgi:phosphodiesterase/alkaline phosphatase D-like protein